jgi:hypothetical protein
MAAPALGRGLLAAGGAGQVGRPALGLGGGLPTCNCDGARYYGR